MGADPLHTDTALVDGESGTVGPGSQMHADALLQASRRVDWRFLLPDPTLRQVAYVGPPRETLLKSLRLFSASLTVVDRSAWADPSAPRIQYSVVVVVDPTVATLQHAIKLLRPGGWLYVEAYGIWSHRGTLRIRQLRSARDYVNVLKQLGLQEIEAYWVWPNFESCAELIPLGDQAALLHALARHQSSPRARLMSIVGRWLLRSGLLGQVVPCFSVVAHQVG